VPVRIDVLPALPLTAVGKLSKPHLRLMAIDRVLREALDAEGLHATSARSRLGLGGGIAVELSGPESLRAAALATAGRYPVSVLWQEQAA